MTGIKIYGGINEIGGNKILVDSDGTHILLDFGRRMGYASEFYSEFLQIRSKNAFRDLIRLDILPKIDGIYTQHYIDTRALLQDPTQIEKIPFEEAPDYWYMEGIEPYDPTNPVIDGVFITHAHFDHIQDLSFLDPSIPVYATDETKILAKAICNVSKQDEDDQFYVCKRKRQIVTKGKHYKTLFPGELAYKDESGIFEIPDEKTGYKFTQEYIPVIRNFKTEDSGKIGGISYKLIPVDHSVPGACSVLLTFEDEKKLLYTGDLRFHGSSGPTIDEYVAGVGTNIDTLLVEGTRIDSEDILEETIIKEHIKDDINKSKGLVLINFNWKDISRFKVINEVSKELGKTLVITPKLAYLLYEMHLHNPAKYENPRTMEGLKVYVKREDSLLYSKVDYDKWKMGYIHHHGVNLRQADMNMCRIAEILDVQGGDENNPKNPLKGLAEPLCDYQEVYDLATEHLRNGLRAYEIRKEPEKYVIMFSYWDSNELFDLIPLENGENNATYICASTEPFNDEMYVDEEKFMKWLDHFNVAYEWEEKEKKRVFTRRHVSGHASQKEIIELVEKLKPKRIIPIHTTKSKKFQELFKTYEVILPEYGVDIPI